jgi:hypothetical protein
VRPEPVVPDRPACHRYPGGSATQDGATVTIAPTASDSKICPGKSAKIRIDISVSLADWSPGVSRLDGKVCSAG